VVLEWEGKHLGFPRLTADCEYLSPARFEDELETQLTVEKRGEKSISYSFHITRGEITIARGHIKVACCICHPDNRLEAVAIPAFIADKIEAAPGD
jgi:acyl-CoA thioesterase FadM